MLLVVIYDPNKNQSQFYSNLHAKILETGQGNICIVGDFNAVANIRKNYITSTKKKKKRNTVPTSFFEMIQELNLVAQWRRLNLEKKEYTFYSNPHKSWSRLDMVWMNIELGSELESIKIMTNV
uniref:Endonuclease/exonuclease/phosphatase domain-containing protein n=1 Tax=Micrurus paraensis TaxID=1970185 RepID=A0A2D4L267_9SAUR